jgi:hypothetical protein
VSACSAGRTLPLGRAGGRLSIAIRAFPRNPGPSSPTGNHASSVPRIGFEAGWRRAGWGARTPPGVSNSFVRVSIIQSSLAAAVSRYESDDDLGALFDAIRALAKSADIDALVEAADAYSDRPEVVIPVYEHVVAQRPGDARALVALANAYWLSGRGPEVVGDLATRARDADPENRGAWHLWALAESNVRGRVERWRRVSERFPEDQLARAALADNAAGLAGAEHDPLALDLAIRTYETLWQESPTPTQRRALEQTLETLRSWKL